jgi:hypothetical protein
MRLVNVYDQPHQSATVLWQLLMERSPDVNISHKAMPTWHQHIQFVLSEPYERWYMIDAGEQEFVGAVYLSKQHEVGIGVLRRYAGMKLGRTAVRMLMEMHPSDRFLANINPRNWRSIQMFRDELGFTEIQVTYERRTK